MQELTLQEVAARLGCAMSTIYKLKSAPDFPRPVSYVSQKKCWWSAADIEKFMRNRAKDKFRN